MFYAADLFNVLSVSPIDFARGCVAGRYDVTMRVIWKLDHARRTHARVAATFGWCVNRFLVD